MQKINEKIKHLSEFIENKYGVTLARALGESDNEIKKICNGEKKVPFWVVWKASSFFFFEHKVLTDDSIELPSDEKLQCDNNVIAILKDDYENKITWFRNKHVVARNYRVLSHGKRVSLWVTTLLVAVPMIAFTLGCFTAVAHDRNATIAEFKNSDKMSDSQLALKEEVDGDTDSTYCVVNTGTEIEKVTDISQSSNSFTARLSAWFDFDQLEFHDMFYKKTKGEAFNANKHFTDDDLKADYFSLDLSYDVSYAQRDFYKEGSDGIPDVLQFEYNDGDHPASKAAPKSKSGLYYEDEALSFPGEQQSNNFTDRRSEFFIGNGSFTPDSLDYREEGRAYKDADGNYRYFQKVHFDAKIEKVYNSQRYPLDSVQFEVLIQPNESTSYIRYNLADEVKIADELVGYNGYAPTFTMTNGYRRINANSDIKNLTTKIYYYEIKAEDSPTNSRIIKTESSIIIRANKSGISSFIQAFINVFAVAIWMVIAFFNQSYNNENSIGMIGTGLFAAISSILVGVSMVTDANIFSLITMINVFTLATILIMAYESIAAKRSSVKDNKAGLAYRTVKLRFMFYLIVACSLVMFIALPMTAYMFAL